jgi:hypothetical protein
MTDNRVLQWTTQGVMVDDHITAKNEGRKGVFVSNIEILELVDKKERERRRQHIKKILGDTDCIHGVAMLKIQDTPSIKRYQVFCSWLPSWHIQNLGSCIDISYQDSKNGEDMMLSIIIRKKYKKCIKSITKLLTNEELTNITSSINIQKIAEDALVYLDSQNT